MSEPSILIADDEALIRLDIGKMLRGAGHFVCGEPNNGLKAVELAKSLAPNLDACWREMQEVRSILETTQQGSHSHKLISQAKAILATLEGISEYEAHSRCEAR